MDVREKLVDLLKDGIRKGLRARGDDRLDYSFEDVADYLIASGVTVQECGRWKYYHKQNIAVCTNCGFERDLDANFGRAVSCPNCGAKMYGERK